MPNPPYSGSVVILVETEDGISARVFHWDDIADGEVIPPSPIGLLNSLKAANPTYHTHRFCATRAALEAAFKQYVTAKYPDTPAQ